MQGHAIREQICLHRQKGRFVGGLWAYQCNVCQVCVLHIILCCKRHISVTFSFSLPVRWCVWFTLHVSTDNLVRHEWALWCDGKCVVHFALCSNRRTCMSCLVPLARQTKVCACRKSYSPAKENVVNNLGANCGCQDVQQRFSHQLVNFA